MTYEPRPNSSGDTLVKSRDQIRTNFEIIQNRFEDNHATFGTVTGHHTRIDLNEQTTFPATGVDESWLASRAYNTRTELAWRPENQLGTGDQFFLSAMPIRAAGYFIINTAVGVQSLLGRSFNVQSVDRQANDQFKVTFATPLPAGTTNYFVQGMIYALNGGSGEVVGIREDLTKDINECTLRGVTTTPALLTRRFNFIIYGG